MTENKDPKPFNISRQKCSVEQYILGLSINQSINQQIHLPSNWLSRIQIKDYQKFKRFVYRLSYLLHVFVIIKWRRSFVMTKID